MLVILVAAALSCGRDASRATPRTGRTYARDAVPAGAVYTVVGTAYMVIVAFVFFIAFENYHAVDPSCRRAPWFPPSRRHSPTGPPRSGQSLTIAVTVLG